MRRVLIALLASAALTSSLLVASQAQAATASLPTTLYAGHWLTAGGYYESLGSALQSSDHRFALALSPDFVQIEEVALLNGSHGPDSNTTGIWFRDDPTGYYQSNTDHSTLKMQTDGNLVLRTSSGHVLWASGTAHTGANNYLVMQTDGNLVMYTSARKAVWASGSKAIFLTPGQMLKPNQVMEDRWGDQQGPVHRQFILKMQTDGNLVYRCNSTVKWASNTHVAGSYLIMQTDGNLVMYTSARKAIWATNTQKSGTYTWFDGAGMAVYNFSNPVALPVVKWQANIPYSPNC